MVATAIIFDDTGGSDNAPGSTTDVDGNLRYREADNNDQDSIDSVTIPASGTKWSFWKHNFIQFNGTFTQINNISLYIVTFNWVGATLWIDDNTAGLTHASGGLDDGYDIADGLNNLNTHSHIVTPVNAGTTHFDSNTSKPIDIDEPGGIIDAVGEESNYWVTALELTTSALPGTQPGKPVVIEYDEI